MNVREVDIDKLITLGNRALILGYLYPEMKPVTDAVFKLSSNFLTLIAKTINNNDIIKDKGMAIEEEI